MVRGFPTAHLQVPLRDTTPGRTLQFREIFPSPSMPQLPQQPNSAMGQEHQKALWTLSAAKDKAPEPSISGEHVLIPLPSKHQPALLPPQHPTAQGQTPTATTLGTKPHGQDPLTPLNKSHHPHSPQKPGIPKRWDVLQQGWRGNEHPAPAVHSMDPSPAPAQTPAQAPELKLLKRRPQDGSQALRNTSRGRAEARWESISN